MTHEEIEKLFKYADTSPEAIRHRLILARLSTGMMAKDIAADIGLPKQTYHSQEANGSVSIKTGRYFYRKHGIDFNFLFYGDGSRLSAETIERLAQSARSEGCEPDQKSNSD